MLCKLPYSKSILTTIYCTRRHVAHDRICFLVYRMAVHDDSRSFWSHSRCGQFDRLGFMCYFRGDDSLFFAFRTKDRLFRSISLLQLLTLNLSLIVATFLLICSYFIGLTSFIIPFGLYWSSTVPTFGIGEYSLRFPVFSRKSIFY